MTTPALHTALPRVTRHWYIACTGRDLGETPLRRFLFGTPLVLFRNAMGRAVAFLDRCPHRNVPLSQGKVIAGRLSCFYHGWSFASDGTCCDIPALGGAPSGKAHRAVVFPAREHDGYVWVYGEPAATPTTNPFRFALLGDRRYGLYRYAGAFRGTLLNTLENILDVPHTAFLHGGLFRTRRRLRRVRCVVKRTHGCVEATYLDEPVPGGALGRLLVPGGGTVAHVDRFLVPGIAQVEYRLGDRGHLLITNALTPARDFVTQLHTLVALRLPRVPGWAAASILATLLRPLVRRIVHQDETALRLQSEAIARFGGERFASSGADVLGPHILRLLRCAERDEVGGGEDIAEQLTLWL